MEEMIFIRLLPQPKTRGTAFPFFEIATYYSKPISSTAQKINAVTNHAKEGKKKSSLEKKEPPFFHKQKNSRTFYIYISTHFQSPSQTISQTAAKAP